MSAPQNSGLGRKFARVLTFGLWGRPEAPPPIPLSTLVLGDSGSGKTVFMAAFYRYFTLNADKGMQFVCTDRQRFLDDIWHTIAKGEWPEGNTSEIIPYHFDILAHDEGRDASKVGAVRYLDYRGEDVVRPDALVSSSAQLQEAIATSSALLVMLNGQRLTNEITSNQPTADTARILGVLHRLLLKDRTRPIQMMVSKWDYAKANNVDLTKLKSWLTRYDEWNAILRNPAFRTGRHCIIPVSAVGYNFCRMNRGRFERIPGELPHPHNVDIPFVLAFLEPLQSHVANTQGNADRWGLTAVGLIRWLVRLGSKPFSSILNEVGGEWAWLVDISGFMDDTMTILSKGLVRGVDIGLGVMEDQLQQVARERNSAKKDKKIFVTKLLIRALEFQKEFPDAVLNDRA